MTELEFTARDDWEEHVEEYAGRLQNAWAVIEVAKSRLKAKKVWRFEDSVTGSQSGGQAAMVFPEDLLVR